VDKNGLEIGESGRIWKELLTGRSKIFGHQNQLVQPPVNK